MYRYAEVRVGTYKFVRCCSTVSCFAKLLGCFAGVIVFCGRKELELWRAPWLEDMYIFEWDISMWGICNVSIHRAAGHMRLSLRHMHFPAGHIHTPLGHVYLSIRHIHFPHDM